METAILVLNDLPRREVLKATDADLKAELQYCRDIIEDHPKNYQVRN